MYSSQNCNHLTLFSLVKHFCPLLELLEKVVKTPLFPEENLDTVKKNNKSYFMVNSHKVDVLSQRHFEHSLWGAEHPLGHIVVPEDYDAMTREDILQYYNAVYGSANCTIFIGGSVDERMISAIEELFGCDNRGAQKLSTSFEVSAPVPIYSRKNVRVEGALQSSVKIGFMAMDSGDDDFFKFRFLTVLLGGYFSSRLMSNIRERNGYTYHIAAKVDAYGRRNAFMVSSETANEYVEPLIKEVYNEIGALLEKPVSDNELELVRHYIMGELCREYEGVSAKSEVFINTCLSGESFDSVNQYIKAVSSITSEKLYYVAKKYLSRENMIEIVAGATSV
jgi:predicted Zn-dependent peptidase